MAEELEPECETIGKELSKITDDNLPLKIYDEFLEAFGYTIDFKEDWKTEFSKASLTIKNIMTKLLRNQRSCIIFGETSVGKSSLTNALLKMDLLKSDFGVTSNCFVKIKPTDEEQGYIEFNKQRGSLEDLKHLNDFHGQRKLQCGTHVDAFINKRKSQFLKDDFVLIDTPGINHDNAMDEVVEELAGNADVVILVINSTSSINDTIKTFINRFKNLVSKLNFIIVFNYWDVPDICENRENTKFNFLNYAKKFLCDVLSYNNMEAEERIFFLSAKEQIMLNNNDPAVKEIPNWEQRRDSFIQFQETLNDKSLESSLHRKRGYLMELHFQVSKWLNAHENATGFIRSEIEQVRTEFVKIKDLDTEINSKVEKIFEKTSSIFIEKAREIVGNKELDEEKQEKELLFLLKKLIDEGTVELKETITNLIEQKLESNIEFRGKIIKMVENIYFPWYIGNDEQPESFRDNIIAIKNRKKYTSIGTGILTGLILPFANKIPGKRILFTGLSIANLYGGISLFKFFEEPYKFIWGNNAAPIEDFVKNVKDELSKSYPKFIGEMQQKLENLLKQLDEINSLQDEFKQITEKIKHFDERNNLSGISSN